jgi:DNA polymerase-3 subunit delta
LGENIPTSNLISPEVRRKSKIVKKFQSEVFARGGSKPQPMSQTLGYEAALKEFEGGAIRPVYLLFGEEPFLFDELVAAARRRLTPPGLEDFNFSRFDGATVAPSEVTSAAETLPFMAEKRLVVVGEARFFRPGRRKAAQSAKAGSGRSGAEPAEPDPEVGEEEAEGDAAAGESAAAAGVGSSPASSSEAEPNALLSYLASPSPTTCLIFTLTSGRERRLPDPDRRLKVTKAAERAGALVNCAKLKDWQAARWAAQRAAGAGKQLDQGAALELIHTVGDDLRTVAQELQKVALYTGDRPVITPGDIAAVASPTAERRVWDLVDALGYRRREQALELLRALDRQGVHPLAVMGLMTMQLRRLLKTRVLLDAETDQAGIAAALGVQPFLVGRLVEQGRGFTAEELIRAISRTFETDLLIKTTETDPALAVELLLLDLV